MKHNYIYKNHKTEIIRHFKDQVSDSDDFESLACEYLDEFCENMESEEGSTYIPDNDDLSYFEKPERIHFMWSHWAAVHIEELISFLYLLATRIWGINDLYINIQSDRFIN